MEEINDLEKREIKKYTDILDQIKFNGGGHLNHEFFWESLAPLTAGGGFQPGINTKLRKLIIENYGSFDKFIELFSAQTAAI